MKSNNKLSESQMDRFAEAATKHLIEKQLRAKYEKVLKERKETKKKKENVIKLNSLAKIAVVVVAILGSMHLIRETYFSPDLQTMAQNFLDQTNISGNQDVTRKGTRSAKSFPQGENKIDDIPESQIVREANDAFIAKDYAMAIAKYEALEKQNKLQTIDQFYLGTSHLKVGNMTNAIVHFQNVEAREKTQIEEVSWLLSLSYILSNQKEKAIPILEEIKTKKGYKTKEASRLLKKIK